MMSAASTKGVRMAIAHEWLEQRAGSEKTFEALAECFPAADLYALTVNRSNGFDLDHRLVRATFLDRVGALRDHRALSLPLMPLAWRFASSRQYDVVITSSHACVKGFWPARSALHLCYCYTPMRYAWLPQLDNRRLRGPLTRGALATLRSWDRHSADWVDSFAAISAAVRDRIRRFYGRSARVIHPPVDVDFFTPSRSGERSDFVLAVSRFIPYKRMDLAIEAASEAQVDLVIAGSGPEEARLRKLAAERHPHRVRFHTDPESRVLRDLYRRARAVVYPAHEDFGIVPVEAQACGTPVVALGKGGTAETVVHGETGVLVAVQDARSMAQGIRDVLRADISAQRCVVNAQRFSRARFTRRIHDWFTESHEGWLASA